MLACVGMQLSQLGCELTLPAILLGVQEERDYERFLEELEEDPEMRSRVDIFKYPNAMEEHPMHECAMGEDGEGMRALPNASHILCRSLSAMRLVQDFSMRSISLLS